MAGSERSQMQRERRWVVISEASDCRHTWLGRHRDPDPAELYAVASQLQTAGIAAWLAVTEGTYYSDDPLEIMLVRPLSGDGDWEAARAAFLSKRSLALKAP